MMGRGSRYVEEAQRRPGRERPAQRGQPRRALGSETILSLFIPLFFSACRTVAPVAPAVAEPAAECPDPPPAASLIDEARILARVAREARANLMTRVGGSQSGLHATLHPPELSVIEATLVSPSKARQMDQAWLRAHLLRAVVELQSPTAIASLDGDTRPILLLDAGGVAHEALYLEARSDSQGWIYRLVFDPDALRFEGNFARFTLRVPVNGQILTAQWGLSRDMLHQMEELPIVHLLAPLRATRRARAALLLGDRAAAARFFEEALTCAPDSAVLQDLRRALRSPEKLPANDGAGPRAAKKPVAEELSLSLTPLRDAARQGLLSDLGHDPLRDLSLRAALLARVTPAVSTGFVPADSVRRAQQDLRTAAAAFSQGSFGLGFPSALASFDRTLADLLVQALDVGSPLARGEEQMTVLSVKDAPVLEEDEVLRELRRRVALAKSGLLPHWVEPWPRGAWDHAGWTREERAREGPQAFPSRRLRFLEMRPVLKGQHDGYHVLAKPHQRLGWGWIHPGLPPVQYGVSLVDHGGDYWRGRLQAAKRPEELRALARELLLREAEEGPDDQAAALAMAGLVQLRGEDNKAATLCLNLAEAGTAPRAAAALRALASLRKPEVDLVLRKQASSTRPEVREGALRALGERGLPEELPLLRAALDDPKLEVAAAALEGLLRARPLEGAKRVRAWLFGAEEGRREAALQMAARLGPRLGFLRGDLERWLGRETASERAVQAAARVLGGAAARPLSRLFEEAPSLRRAILEQVEGTPFEKLYLRAAALPEAELRLRGVLKLAQLPRPPRAVLQRVLSDTDPGVRLAAHAGLARLGRAESLLALGSGARGQCEERGIVLPTLCRAMDPASRRRLIADALESECFALWPVAWELAVRYHAEDSQLLKVALGHRRRTLRVQAALVVLGLRTGAALGVPDSEGRGRHKT